MSVDPCGRHEELLPLFLGATAVLVVRSIGHRKRRFFGWRETETGLQPHIRTLCPICPRRAGFQSSNQFFLNVNREQTPASQITTRILPSSHSPVSSKSATYSIFLPICAAHANNNSHLESPQLEFLTRLQPLAPRKITGSSSQKQGLDSHISYGS